MKTRRDILAVYLPPRWWFHCWSVPFFSAKSNSILVILFVLSVNSSIRDIYLSFQIPDQKCTEQLELRLEGLVREAELRITDPKGFWLMSGNIYGGQIKVRHISSAVETWLDLNMYIMKYYSDRTLQVHDLSRSFNRLLSSMCTEWFEINSLHE